MNQNERRRYLIENLLKEQPRYAKMRIPTEANEQRTILRSLMNIRMPGSISEEFLQVQDEYLTEVGKEKGIVSLSEMEEVQPDIYIWQGDITRLQVDAIVNAANSQMLGCFVPMHTCIDNCIHSFAGIQLREECDQKMQELRSIYGEDYEQPTAVPMLTDAYNLPAKKVIHIVGPIVQWQLTQKLEKDLADCYRNTLDMCLKHGLKSVAFCCISTGVFHFPNERAGEIAVETVTEWMNAHLGMMERVIFNVFKDEDKWIYEELLK